MYLRKSDRPRVVTLDDGSIFSMADLPPANTRWVARRKAAVVKAVESGLMPRDEVIERYGLSAEELDSWIRAVSAHGPAALKVTLIQRFRSAPDEGQVAAPS